MKPILTTVLKPLGVLLMRIVCGICIIRALQFLWKVICSACSYATSNWLPLLVELLVKLAIVGAVFLAIVVALAFLWNYRRKKKRVADAQVELEEAINMRDAQGEEFREIVESAGRILKSSQDVVSPVPPEKLLQRTLEIQDRLQSECSSREYQMLKTELDSSEFLLKTLIDARFKYTDQGNEMFKELIRSRQEVTAAEDRVQKAITNLKKAARNSGKYSFPRLLSHYMKRFVLLCKSIKIFQRKLVQLSNHILSPKGVQPRIQSSSTIQPQRLSR